MAGRRWRSPIRSGRESRGKPRPGPASRAVSSSQGDENDDRWAITVKTNMDHLATENEILSEARHGEYTAYVIALEPKVGSGEISRPQRS
jgi:hypothetical protein